MNVAKSFAVFMALAGAMVVNLPLAARADGATPASNPVIARGKGFEVRRNQLDEAWAIYRARFSRAGQLPNEPRDSVETKLLNHIIETEILVRKATVEEKKQAQEAADKVIADSRKRFGSDDDYRGWLKTMGMTPDQYRTRTIEQRTSELVIDREVKPSTQVSDEMVKKAYDENPSVFDKPEQVRLRQIWFATVDPATQQPLPDERRKQKEKLAKEVKARIDRGEDFFKLYKEFSDEPWAKEETAGDEPAYTRGRLAPALDAAAFSLQPNQVSPVLESPMGYHILRVSEVQPASRLSLAEVAPRLREFLVDEEIKKQMPEYLERVRKDAAVEIIAPPSTAKVEAAK